MFIGATTMKFGYNPWRKSSTIKHLVMKMREFNRFQEKGYMTRPQISSKAENCKDNFCCSVSPQSKITRRRFPDMAALLSDGCAQPNQLFYMCPRAFAWRLRASRQHDWAMVYGKAPPVGRRGPIDADVLGKCDCASEVRGVRALERRWLWRTEPSAPLRGKRTHTAFIWGSGKAVVLSSSHLTTIQTLDAIEVFAPSGEAALEGFMVVLLKGHL